MGAWGPGIFSDDTAADIRSDYRELLEDQVADGEALARIIEAYRHLDADEEHLLWLALAASQSQVGRLDEQVRARALDVIDTGRGLELWEEAGPKEIAKRRMALGKLRAQLTGPQPARRTLRRLNRPGFVGGLHQTQGDSRCCWSSCRKLRMRANRLGVSYGPVIWVD